MPHLTPSRLAAIYVGGVIGALLRVGLAEVFPHGADSWPWPTFAVNLVGAFLIGFFFTALRDQGPHRLHHPFLATGICGTLTTFSTLQLELFEMVNKEEMVLAFGYLTASLAAGYALLRVGIAVAERRMETPA